MPSHYGNGNSKKMNGMNGMKKRVAKSNGSKSKGDGASALDPAKLPTTADMMREASKHHSKKHMDMMKDLMKEGMGFAKAHALATKYVGK
jgi:hypothetical protein